MRRSRSRTAHGLLNRRTRLTPPVPPPSEPAVEAVCSYSLFFLCWCPLRPVHAARVDLQRARRRRPLPRRAPRASECRGRPGCCQTLRRCRTRARRRRHHHSCCRRCRCDRHRRRRRLHLCWRAGVGARHRLGGRQQNSLQKKKKKKTVGTATPCHWRRLQPSPGVRQRRRGAVGEVTTSAGVPAGPGHASVAAASSARLSSGARGCDLQRPRGATPSAGRSSA